MRLIRIPWGSRYGAIGFTGWRIELFGGRDEGLGRLYDLGLTVDVSHPPVDCLDSGSTRDGATATTDQHLNRKQEETFK